MVEKLQPEHINPENLDEDVGRLANAAYHSLVYIGESLNTKGRIKNTQPLLEALTRWVHDEHHGAIHSFHVYEKMKYLAEKEGKSVKEEDLWWRAVLHDIGEYLPKYDQEGDPVELTIVEKGKRSRRHQFVIKSVIEEVGKELEYDEHAIRQLALDVAYHDVFWTRPSQDRMGRIGERLSPAGKILADADRLVFETEGSIARNRKVSLGRWYFLRPELTSEERQQWEMRTGGLFDGASAILREFYGSSDWMFTESGKREYEARKPAFTQTLVDFYKAQYQLGWNILKDATDLRSGVNMSEIKDLELDKILHLARVDKSLDLTQLDENELRGVMRYLMTQPIEEKSRDGRKYFGYSVKVHHPELGEVWLDPSVLHFDSEDDLEAELRKAVEKYEVT